MTAVRQHRPVREVILGSPRPVWVLVAGVFLNRAGSFFATFLVLFLKQLGFTAGQVPLVLLGAGAAIPVGSLLGGWAADRFSRKQALIGCTLAASASLAVAGLAANRPVALAGVFAAALFAQAYLPAASALLIDNTAEADRVPTFALFRLALNVGAALGPLLAALLSSHGVQFLFVVDSLSYLLFAFVLTVGLPAGSPAAGLATDHRPEPERQQEPGSRAASAAKTPGSAQPAPTESSLGLIALFGAVLLITVVYVQYFSSIALAVSQHRTAAAYATLLTLNGALVIVAEVPLSSWTRRLDWWQPILGGIALMSLGIAGSGAFGRYWLVVLCVIVWTTGEMLFSPVVSTAVAAVSPADRTGRYQGYLGTVQATGFAIGPALGTALYGYHPPVLWSVCLICGVLAGAGVLISWRASLAAAASGDAPADRAVVVVAEERDA